MPSPIHVSAGVAWDSHYVSEGRDNLSGDSLASAKVEASLLGFCGGLWYARNPAGNYDELNAFLGYDFSLGPLELYAA